MNWHYQENIHFMLKNDRYKRKVNKQNGRMKKVLIEKLDEKIKRFPTILR